MRRVNISDKKTFVNGLRKPKKITYLPNTAGCFTSEDALRTLRLAREIGGLKLVKLEVLGDKKSLLPDMIETLKSTEVLSKEGLKLWFTARRSFDGKKIRKCRSCRYYASGSPDWIRFGYSKSNQY